MRIFTFPDRPDCLLVVMSEREPSLGLPPLVAPFTKTAVATACGDAGLTAYVADSVPGRWTSAMTKGRRDETARLGQMAKLRESSEAAILRGSNVPEVKQAAEAMARKLEVDEEIRTLKKAIGAAKSNAFTRGEYLPADKFRRLESRLETAKQESQALQARLGELKREGKSLRSPRTELERFKAIVRNYLEADEFLALEEESRDESHVDEARAS